MKSDIEKFLYRFTNSPQKILPIFKELVYYTELEPLEFLAKTNENATDFFIVKSGIIRSYYQTEDGKEATRALFTPGFVSGPTSAMMRNIPSELNYQALTKVTGFRGNFFKLKELAEKHHELSLFYIKTLEDAYLKAEHVILDISTNNATERYINLRERIPGIDNLLAQKHIASYLNVSTVQLSRIKKSLLK